MKCSCTSAGFCRRHQIDKNEHWLYLCQNNHQYFNAWEQGRGPGQDKQHSTGVGTELKKLISWFPVPKTNNCLKCKALETKLNIWGPDKCKEKKQYILNKLRIAAARRKLPYSERLITILLDKAIKNSV